ncbi:Pentatricopeptide repeat-containing protein [Apostasia shenzhenica]|uniref:Pentatricopeptide repeat-containing protein n=1 Tax=Apostasia shenzhenica TaxID=1088818 RepID=A0A2I0AHN2_9ASPA|nr:Pentatricopeptide repeat-containing protein [Apostasia shenzhenica]
MLLWTSILKSLKFSSSLANLSLFEAQSLRSLRIEAENHNRSHVHSLLVKKIKHSAKNGSFEETLHLHRLLRASTADSNRLPFVHVLKACGGLSALHEGLSIHALIIKAGLHGQLSFANSLIELYADLAHLEGARQVFDDMPQRNIVSWNLMMAAYAACGQPLSSLIFYALMNNKGIDLDAVGLKIILPICGEVEALELGKSIHARLLHSGLSGIRDLATSTLVFYEKCGDLGAARKVFGEMPNRDVVSWNAMITAYSHARKFKPALELFAQMLAQGIKPSIPSLLLALQACTNLSGLQLGKVFHGLIIRIGFYADISINGLLVDMYSKCGELRSACGVFMEITRGNVSSWSCMINGLGIHGHLKESLMLFFAMLKKGIEADDICFLLLISSCSHLGMVKEGLKVLYYMTLQFQIEPKEEHWASVVDLIGRAGWIDEAVRLLNEMTLNPNSSLLGSFLGACKIHGKEDVGKMIGDWLIQGRCNIPGFYKLLVSINAGNDEWDEVIKLREVIEERRLKGNSGASLIEVRRSW